jgi:signal transduction histidine kinase
MTPPILTAEIRSEHDVVLARQRARQIAGLLGFDAQDQARIATAVSEIARNAYQYAGRGTVTFELTSDPGSLVISIADRGPGIARLSEVLDGRYHSPTGLGLGILGARRLTDRFDIRSVPQAGTTVELGMLLPPRAAGVSADTVSRLGRELALHTPHDPLTELREQNHEVLRTLDELRERQVEVERLNQELAETNRGVLALYAELDEKAADLARASELKSRFLSNISHELRTPLNAILNITGLLLDHMDGPLNEEQERQVRFVRAAATTLTEMVNDLLDLARIEAGRSVVRPTTFTVADLFGALRGMFRALAPSERAVALIFEDPAEILPLSTDEGKLSQILRNFIANALKFTEQGEVRVSAAASADGRVTFTVADTGIGIAPSDQERIFEEFSQLDSALQRKATGAGLGLPLSRKLAELLGGGVAVSSIPGAGSTFSVTIPACYVQPARVSNPALPAAEIQHA